MGLIATHSLFGLVTARSVRILLECFLVELLFFVWWCHHEMGVAYILRAMDKRVSWQQVAVFTFWWQRQIWNITKRRVTHSSFYKHNIGNNANIGIRGFTTWKQKNSSNKMLPPVSTESLDLWFQVKHFVFIVNISFACTTETSDSLCSHALLILTKSSKSKTKVVHEQKFKEYLSSTEYLSSKETHMIESVSRCVTSTAPNYLD